MEKKVEDMYNKYIVLFSAIHGLKELKKEIQWYNIPIWLKYIKTKYRIAINIQRLTYDKFNINNLILFQAAAKNIYELLPDSIIGLIENALIPDIHKEYGDFRKFSKIVVDVQDYGIYTIMLMNDILTIKRDNKVISSHYLNKDNSGLYMHKYDAIIDKDISFSECLSSMIQLIFFEYLKFKE